MTRPTSRPTGAQLARTRRAAGLCTGCGGTPREGKRQCEECADKSNKRSCKRQQQIPKSGRRVPLVRPIQDRAEATRLFEETRHQLLAIATRGKRWHRSVEDLYQECCLAFLRCVARHDATKGHLEHYTSRAAQRAVVRYVAANRGPISVDAKPLIAYRKAERSGLTEAAMPASVVAAARAGRVRGLDDRIRNDTDMTVGETLRAETETPEERLGREQTAAMVRRSLGKLAPREAAVIEACYLGPEERAYQALAVEMGLSRARVQQIAKGALEKLGERKSGLRELVES